MKSLIPNFNKKFDKHTLKPFLVNPPYLTNDPDYSEEGLIREGLKNLNDTINLHLNTPTPTSGHLE